MSDTVNAWLLDFGPKQQGLVATYELIEVVDKPQLFHVPGANSDCNDTLVWNGQILPVANFGSSGNGLPPQAVIVAAQLEPYKPLCYGAFCLYSSPTLMKVSDSMACPLPKDNNLHALAISSISHKGTPVPIIDISRVFFAPI